MPPVSAKLIQKPTSRCIFQAPRIAPNFSGSTEILGPLFKFEPNSQYLPKSKSASDNLYQGIDIAAIFTQISKKIEQFKLKLSKSNAKASIEHNIENIDEVKDALEKMQTPYDTKNIIMARIRALIAGTLKVNGDKKKLARNPFTSQILSDMSNEIQQASKQKRLIIVSGGAASGKNTYISSNHNNSGFLLADSDIVKTKIPGYEEFGAGFVHSTSASLTTAEVHAALEEGCDIIYPTTGIRAISDTISKARSCGYNSIQVVYCDAPKEIRAKRVIKRFEDTNRFVDPYYVLNERTSVDDIEQICLQNGINLEKITTK